ncbi:MAG: methionine synthase [Bacteroidetes bacterium HGW-Bacteroidetes-21]|jgi:5-methyltetrahydrofolate--homocysteine methyltransferase|nr:MAG: methionine synthase [Bacteroidetes bacterium HGW-Bacteroidetes-21]
MRHLINNILENRILVLDGAMGTMIQQHKLREEDYRGVRFGNHPLSLKGNNDLLSLTQPAIIQEIHEKYLEAGADIIETNTFNAQRISLADYQIEHLVYEINVQAAKIAKAAAEKFSTTDKPRFVAGSIGPTNKTASISPDVNNPGFRAVSYFELVRAYAEQVKGLIDGGCDLLLVETIFDTLNAKACLYAISEVFADKGCELPVMISVTITDASGRTLSGQTPEAFLTSVSHFPMLSIGLNCALGARQIKPFLQELAQKSSVYISVYPNAGLPNQFGDYDEAPSLMAEIIKEFIDEKIVNIVGGCCGTGPEHIRLMAELVVGVTPRTLNKPEHVTRLSGLESLTIEKATNFVNIGERTNVAGSKKFARLIREKNYEEALSVARQQIESGAQIIDINLDDGMLVAEKEMEIFLRLISSDPDITRVPVMIDSSKWTVIEKGLQNIQGKPIVNSISLKEGEKEFLRRANIIRKLGAATVIMAFDEEGQATDFESKIRVCERAYKLLTEKMGFPPEDIVFDCNILTIGTGLPEHNNFAVDFIKAVTWIKENLPHAKTSGGISNLSFAFRGNNKVREAMHTVFLYHAINAGLDMGIVNAGALPVYDDIEPGLRQLCEDIILNRRKDATERLLTFAETLKDEAGEQTHTEAWRELPLEERLTHSLIKGIPDYIEADIREALNIFPQALTIIEGPLMTGMNKVGELFGSGRMFLPQVMKSARVMKKAVAILQPVIEEQNKEKGGQTKAGKILLATVKGDVHDIGKNIASVVLSCNNYEIIDLGIMVPTEKIVEEAISQKADIIGLSGLITPSLDEMAAVASSLQKHGLSIPLLIGGATTSKIHTAVKISPEYQGAVVHVKDASLGVQIVSELLNPDRSVAYTKNIRAEYQQMAEDFASKQQGKTNISLEQARENRFVWKKEKAKILPPAFTEGKPINDFPLEKLIPYIDWTFFFHQWRINGKYPAIFNDPVKGPEAKKLYDDAQVMLQRMVTEKMVSANAILGFFEASSNNEDVTITTHEGKTETLHFLRNQRYKEEGQKNLCLADFIAPTESRVTDYIGLFAVTAGIGIEKWENHFKAENDDYSATLLKILADRLAEAFAELLHLKTRKKFWGYASDENLTIEEILQGKYQGIRPAPGYPACPVHEEKEKIFRLLNATQHTGITLTDNWSMYPGASVCGYYFAHPEAKYFSVNE